MVREAAIQYWAAAVAGQAKAVAVAVDNALVPVQVPRDRVPVEVKVAATASFALAS